MSKLNYFVRLFAVIIAMIMWITVVTPVWLFMLLREVAVTAFYSVASNFGAVDKTFDATRLDTIAGFWPNGYRKILDLLSEDTSSAKPLTEVGPLRLASETIFAIVFYLSFAWLPGLILIAFQFTREAAKTFPSYMPGWLAPFVALFLVLFVAWIIMHAMRLIIKDQT